MGTDSEFLPRKSHGERSLEGKGPRNSKRVTHDLATENKNKKIGPNLLEEHFVLPTQKVKSTL